VRIERREVVDTRVSEETQVTEPKDLQNVNGKGEGEVKITEVTLGITTFFGAMIKGDGVGTEKFCLDLLSWKCYGAMKLRRDQS
jgi:hypothetical protein